jgi:hypothetical protein
MSLDEPVKEPPDRIVKCGAVQSKKDYNFLIYKVVKRERHWEDCAGASASR